MAIMEKRALIHLGVRVDGIVRPLCRNWGSSWNWSLIRAEATCPRCRATPAAPEAGDCPPAPGAR